MSREITKNEKSIRELRQSSTFLVSRLQSILDLVGTLLSGRNTKDVPTGLGLHKARRLLKSTMKELAEVNEELKDVYGREIQNRQNVLNDVTAIEEHETKLKDEVKEIEESSQPAIKLSTVLEEEESLLIEKQSLEQRLAAINKQMEKIKVDKSELNSIISSKKSLFLQEIEDCERRKSKLAGDSQGTTDTLSETLGREIEAYIQEQERAMKENQALKDGVTVWKSCCQYLLDLETQIKGILEGTQENESKSQSLLQAINNTIEELQKLLKLAAAEKWELLIVAITQELEGLYESKKLVSRTIASPNNSPPSDSSSSLSLSMKNTTLNAREREDTRSSNMTSSLIMKSEMIRNNMMPLDNDDADVLHTKKNV